jgi:hypothetical protein
MRILIEIWRCSFLFIIWQRDFINQAHTRFAIHAYIGNHGWGYWNQITDEQRRRLDPPMTVRTFTADEIQAAIDEAAK